MAAIRLTVLLCFLGCVTSYKILVHPMTFGFNSRMLNMQKMADMLSEDSHDVTLLINSKIRKHIITKNVKIIEYQVPDDIIVFESFNPTESFKLTWHQYGAFYEFVEHFWMPFCKHLLADDAVMASLREAKFDLLLGDILDECNKVLISHLDVHAVLYQNFGFHPDSKIFYPILPGMNCIFQGVFCLMDEDLGFRERFLNLYLSYKLTYTFLPGIEHKYKELAMEAGVELKRNFHKTFQESVVIINVDFVLDPPRPIMPNIFLISGIFQKAPSPLPQDISDFITGSAPHGVIVFSLGTQITVFEREKADMFAKVFSKLDQRVIWRYTGQLGDVGANTMLVDWFPQKDVLAHPLVRIFITHCGISGTFEAAYNGVPVLAMPLFAEQNYNAAKLVKRAKMGLQLDFFTVTESELIETLKELVSNPKYKKDAVRTSMLLSDKPVSSKHLFLHLVNYTIKTGGAKHLFHEQGLNMTWYQMLGLDVIVTVVAAVTVAIVCITVLSYILLKCLFRQFKKEKTA